MILRPVSSPSMAGGGVFEEGVRGGGGELDGVLLLAFFLSQPIVLFSSASSRILR